MNELNARNVILRPGRPKVAVPLVSSKPLDIVTECEMYKSLPCDIIEWRADYFLSEIEEIDKYLSDKYGYLDIAKILDDINYIADEKPIIFTIRSKSQGGNISVSKEQLESLYSLAAETHLVDFIDIELVDEDGNIDDEWIRRQIEIANNHGVMVILSHHDFNAMPKPTELVEIVKKMYALGADICKVAAMVHDKSEAENLLKTTAYLTKNNIGPIIMLGMGEAGTVTRVAGGKYGSCITFAAGKGLSAPGQPDAELMKKWLDDYYGV